MSCRTGQILVAAVAVAVLGGLVVTGASAQTGDAPVGTAWQRVPLNIAKFGGEGDQVAGDVTAGGPGFVAIGNDSASLNVQPAVWLSEDGRAWRRAQPGADVADPAEARRFEAIASREGTLVVVGTEGIDCAGDFDLGLWGLCERTRPAVWWSTDGETWTRVPHDPAIFDDAGDSTMVDVVAGEDGFYAIGNRRARANWDVDIWFSPDGVIWQRVHAIDTRWPLAAYAIVDTGAGIIGFTTEYVDREVAPIAAVRRGGGWVLATPSEEDPTPANQLASVSAQPGAFNDHIIGLADQFRTPIWSNDEAVFALGPLADGARTVQRSVDGVSWEPRPAAVFTVATASRPHMLVTREGFTAVQFAVEDDGLVTPSWLSADGETWQPSGVAAPPLARIDAGGTGAGGVLGAVRAVAASGTTAVAVGSDAGAGDADAAFWFSVAGPVPEPDTGTVAPDVTTGAEYTTPDGCLLAADAQCQAANLDGADLAGLTAPGADLSVSNLAGADLSGADLSGAILDGADLRNVDLTGADLSGASLEVADLRGATLDGADLTDATLGHTDFTEASLRNITAGSVSFGGSLSSVGAILTAADLREAGLASTDLTSVDLRRASLDGADLTGANLSGAIMTGAGLAGATLRQARLSEAGLSGADLTGLVAREASFTLADLHDAILTNADLTNASLFGADLRGADLGGAIVEVTNFIEAILTGATLPADGLESSDWGSTICPDGFVTGRFPSGSCAAHRGDG